MNSAIHLEVPVLSPSSAGSVIRTGHGGKSPRLELNAPGSYSQGGTTPAPETYRHVVGSANTPLRIMIRPRGPPADGSPDFVYSEAEIACMVRAIREWQASGLLHEETGDGFVLGVLKPREEGEGGGGGGEGGDADRGMVVDVDRNSRLVNIAAPFPCVFHRAFDDILGSAGSTVTEALADLAACGFRGLLTSGGPGRAIDNIDTVAHIVRAAPPSLREVIVGGGVRSANVRALAEVLLHAPVGGSGGVGGGGTTTTTTTNPEIWFHSSCLTDAAAGEEVDEKELSLIVAHVKAIYNSP